MSRVYLAADHAGYALKEALKPYLTELGHEAIDCGASELDSSDDYPDVVFSCVKRVAAEAGSFGIVIGASGQGEAMAANRVKGIRAAVYYGPAALEQEDADGNALSLIASVRSHNDANVLSLGGRFLLEVDAREAVRLFLATPASDEERHRRRQEKLDAG